MRVRYFQPFSRILLTRIEKRRETDVIIGNPNDSLAESGRILYSS